ncbi:hypothetical protein Gohar_008926 [Gossypium harknessii]|uniref:Uncharacterized protein n=1 Tax=Gossypium harknessii TaxID=34285 RepID=A0A7J9GLU6_9ROSI|nr:hypothetical protein [Gossypium harknessii]
MGSLVGEESSIPRKPLLHTSGLLPFIRSYLGGLSALGMPVVGSLGSCVVVRDSHGQVLKACTRLHQHVSSAFATETVAFITVVDFARDLDRFWVEEVPFQVEPAVAADTGWGDPPF